MKRINIYWIVCVLVGAGLSIGMAGEVAAKWILPHFSDVVASSARIARVQVVKAQPILGADRAEAESCGATYTATVTEAFKGGDGDFSFVSVSNEDFLDGHSDYLVFAFDHPKEDADRLLRAARNPSGDAAPETTRARCLSSASQFHVMSWPQTMIPIEPGGEHGFVDGSLLVNRINPFSGLEIEIVEVVRAEGEFGMIDWPAARAMLRKELSGEAAPLRY